MKKDLTYVRELIEKQMRNYYVFDDMTDTLQYNLGSSRGFVKKPRPYPAYVTPQLIQIMHDLGLHDRAAFGRKSLGDQERFLTGAMKRARSNHPHNARWKPLMAVVIAAEVAHALEST